MKTFLSIGMVFFSLLILPASAVADIIVNFDDLDNAPILFANASALTDRYYPTMGVTFSGPLAGEGGVILNQDANFGVNAHSGLNVLAFNLTTNAKDPETIRFETLWQTVSIYVSGGTTTDKFTMDAYDVYDTLVASSNVTTATIWASLSVTSIGGIKKVVLTQDGESGAFVFDDLSASGAVAPVAEPASLLLLIAGITGLAGLRSGRRS
jgi:hypothetical protein